MDVFWVISSKASHSIDRSQVNGELNHAYVNGPVSVKSLHCAQYCVCFKENSASITGFPSSSRRMKSPNAYTRS